MAEVARIETDLRQTVLALSDALDLVGVDDRQHGKRVGVMATVCARELGLSEAEQDFVFDLGLLHDCGVSSTTVHQHLVGELDWEGADAHCRRGEQLLADVDLLAGFAPYVRYHHTHWTAFPKSVDAKVAQLANLVFLVDRVDAFTAPHYGDPALLYHRHAVVERIRALRGRLFAPELVDAFCRAAAPDAFWLFLESPHLDGVLAHIAGRAEPRRIGLTELRDLARLFSRIVDAKSHFTLQHSEGVAAVARCLAEWTGLPAERVAAIEIAGLLHDLGKLRVPDAILDKPGPLDARERAVIERHSFETAAILRRIPGFEEITLWAGGHHEALDGRGYPFGRRAGELGTEARIVAVADVFQALSQNRPYRAALPAEKIQAILRDFVAQGHLDGTLVERLIAHYPEAARAARAPAGENP